MLQYAGNVIVYGQMSPCDGDWFGGVTAANAEQFLRSLVEMEVGCRILAVQELLMPGCLQAVIVTNVVSNLTQMLHWVCIGAFTIL